MEPWLLYWSKSLGKRNFLQTKRNTKETWKLSLYIRTGERFMDGPSTFTVKENSRFLTDLHVASNKSLQKKIKGPTLIM